MSNIPAKYDQRKGSLKIMISWKVDNTGVIKIKGAMNEASAF